MWDDIEKLIEKGKRSLRAAKTLYEHMSKMIAILLYPGRITVCITPLRQCYLQKDLFSQSTVEL